MSGLSDQNPTYEREVVDTGSLAYTSEFPRRGFIVDQAGTVTCRNSNREDAAIAIPVVPGINPHVFDEITAVSGPTTVIAYF